MRRAFYQAWQVASCKWRVACGKWQVVHLATRAARECSMKLTVLLLTCELTCKLLKINWENLGKALKNSKESVCVDLKNLDKHL